MKLFGLALAGCLLLFAPLTRPAPSAASAARREDLPAPAEVVRVAPERLDAYAGRYRVNPDRVLSVTREGDRLYAEPTQSPRFELLPVSETRFVRRDANLRYSFATGAEGNVGRLSIHQGAAAAAAAEAPRLARGVVVPYEM